MRVFIEIQYDGINYSGWQKQKNSNSIQGVLSDALSKFFGSEINIFASGRTDARVHAIGQTAHFDVDIKNNFDISVLPQALAPLLPKDISVLTAKTVDQSFDARKSAKRKTYLYKLYISKVNKPLYCNRMARITNELDLSTMKKAAKYFLGTHDFSAFRSESNLKKDCVRKIYSLIITKNEDCICFKICGNGFLYNMVRIIVGTLIEVGLNKTRPEEIKDIINSKDRTQAGKTAPPEGLYLSNVEY